MIVTFNNRFQLVKQSYDTPRVSYTQSLRADLKVFIDYEPDSVRPANDKRDWSITIEGDKATIEKFKGSVSMEITLYLRQRTRKKVNQLTFLDIVDLAEMKSVE